ncbi:uncharacterized protein [Gossypium hirsutum]|uniref:Uncharacterized protein n=1 Tax=Gossypium hirsutum TaxID=3635 RepID=A0ABM2YZY1_GOSHI|nr:uncharacterized protein LOC121208517 [Gossypium hirsutum]
MRLKAGGLIRGKRLCLFSNHHFFKHPILGFLNTLSATTPPRPTADDGRETPAARSRPTPRGRAPFAGHRPPHRSRRHRRRPPHMVAGSSKGIEWWRQVGVLVADNW